MTLQQPLHRRAALWLLCAGLLVLAACSSSPTENPMPTGGDPASWTLVAPARVNADSRTLKIEVTRVACASGRTGEVLEPTVSYDPDRIVIQVDVGALDDGAYMCLGNDAVPVTIELDEPVGDRALVDGVCLDDEAATASSCEVEVRWPAP